MINPIVPIYLILLLIGAPISASAAGVDQLVTVGEQRVAEGKSAQTQIDKLWDKAGDIEGQYKKVVKVVDGLNVYNDLLGRQVENQTSEITALSESMDKVALIERQIIPLMIEMLDSLEQIIRVDVPFLQEERSERLARLREMMERSDIAAAEKFRQVLEAYEIENDYGRTIEAYTGALEVAGKNREVDFLRIGRVALLYQTVGGEQTGAWNQAVRGWESLPPKQYNKNIAKGLRVAQKHVAPDLLILPIAAPTQAAQ
ncbi:MAG: hypothetical protein ACI915_004838 [Gammaproteobacteria bacterium]